MLTLSLTDYENPTRWRWVLTEGKGSYVADHEVRLGASAIQYRGFVDLPGYLRDFAAGRKETDLLQEVGAWMGVHVFGGLAKALRERLQAPATVVRVVIPAAAQDLVFRPFELAHLDGKSFADHGIRFVYEVEPRRSPVAKEAGSALRVLAVFSLPTGQQPLGLRRERRDLGRVLRNMVETKATAIELRVLQYGATRETLREALEDGDGWDVVHFSGHGLAGEIVLEDDRGGADEIKASDLLPLLLPARSRLSLITLSCCFSAAATVASARAAVGLDAPTRAGEAEGPAATELPSVAQHLAAGLDCAVLAMRYPVDDGFARRLVTGLFEKMLDKKRALPDALQLALKDAAGDEALAAVTPVLFGGRAVDLKLVPPAAVVEVALPARGLFAFPPEPEHFVGRLVPMLDASRALAPESEARGVLFYGMAGAGKTSCAVELAYRHERGRFTGYVWYKAPNEGDDVGTALASFLIAFEAQLGMEERPLIAHLVDPEAFRMRTLPRLKGLLQTSAVLIAIDNVEGLLTSSNGWRDPLWGDVIATLLDHGGRSRVVLTSRQVPVTLKDHTRLMPMPMHALTMPESVVLARELPNLSKLFATTERRRLLVRTLVAAQGHPKLLDLADKQAVDPAALERHLDTRATPGDVVAIEGVGAEARFFAVGETAFRDEEFVAELARWAGDIGAMLPPDARLVMTFLCRVEEEDRVRWIVEANWNDFLERLTGARGRDTDGEVGAGEETRALATRILAMPRMKLEASLEALVASGLVESVEKIPGDGTDSEEERKRKAYRIHPAIVATTLNKGEPAVQSAVDIELGEFWGAFVGAGIANEDKGGGPMIIGAGKRSAPYFIRAGRWELAATVLERVLCRDQAPETLAVVLPQLQYIAAATAETNDEADYMSTLADALFKAGRASEAAEIDCCLIEKYISRGDYRLASVVAGRLVDVLHKTGRFEEALAMTAQEIEYVRRAGLGRWTQISSEGRRLRTLNAMGKYAEVLPAVHSSLDELRKLPVATVDDDIAVDWSTYEALLDVGYTAASHLERWEEALQFTNEMLRARQKRGANMIEILRARFNDYAPLLHLGRHAEVRDLLQACRAGFEAAVEVEDLGKVFGALAELEDKEGQYEAAIRFQRSALLFAYQVHDPDSCAINHNNLAICLRREKQNGAHELAHRLADAVICIQIGSGKLETTLAHLIGCSLPAIPPTFATVVAAVEQTEGTRFAELFASLPKRFPDGDAAIAAVWRNINAHKVLAAMPPVIQAAFQLDGEAALQALKAALSEFSPKEAQRLVDQLRQAGLIG